MDQNLEIKANNVVNISRRDFVIKGGSLMFASALAQSDTETPVHFDKYPFSLGVASGSPSATGVVLWTRIAPEPLAPLGGVTQSTVRVQWEIANDLTMRDIVQSGDLIASAEGGFSVHVEVSGLDPGRWYYYRFLAADAISPVGRTRVAADHDMTPEQLRFAVASCQHYEHGYFSAYRHIVADEPDLIVFLGDYIYETNTKEGDIVRHHDGPPPRTLADYRARYALYRTDPNLQAAHACCPWIVTWDDHEVRNNYAGAWSPHAKGTDKFLERRAAAYRAYYEHMPLPLSCAPDCAELSLYARYSFGDLLTFHVLDGRQYRSSPACPEAGKRLDADCTERLLQERTYLGQAQEKWLDVGFKNSQTQWNIIVQPTLFSPLDRKPGAKSLFSADSWDGYPAARDRLLDSLQAHHPSNPVFIGGDLHAFFVAEVVRNDGEQTTLLASEFVTTSISSRRKGSQRRLDKLQNENSHLLYADGNSRGYTRIELTQEELRADLRFITSAATPDPTCQTAASYFISDGVPGPQRKH